MLFYTAEEHHEAGLLCSEAELFLCPYKFQILLDRGINSYIHNKVFFFVFFFFSIMLGRGRR